MLIFQLPPPTTSVFELIGVNQDQAQGLFVIRDNQYILDTNVESDYLGTASVSTVIFPFVNLICDLINLIKIEYCIVKLDQD